MKTLTDILKNEKIQEVLIVKRLIEHSAYKHHSNLNNNFALDYINKYAVLIRKHYDNALKSYQVGFVK